MSRVEMAVASFKEGMICSQALLSSFSEDLGLDDELAIKLSTPFGGGFALQGEICGAVTAGVMVIGLKHGDFKAKEKSFILSMDFINKFKSRYGSIKCKDLLGYDISTPEGWKRAKDDGHMAAVCPKYVKDAAEIIEQIL